MPPSLRCSKATPLCAWFGTPSLQPLTTTFHPSLWNTKLYFLKHNENSIQAQIEPQLFLIHVRTCSTRQGTHHWKHSKSNTVQSHKGISLDHMFLPATRVRKGLYCRFGQHLSLQAPSHSHQPTISYRENRKNNGFGFSSGDWGKGYFGIRLDSVSMLCGHHISTVSSSVIMTLIGWFNQFKVPEAAT